MVLVHMNVDGIHQIRDQLSVEAKVRLSVKSIMDSGSFEESQQ